MTVKRTTFFGAARAAILHVQRFKPIPLAAAAAAALAVAGCSQEKKTISEIRSSFESSEYRETVALCRHAIRRGIDVSGVYFYYGASLVMLDRDLEGFRQFDTAALRDPVVSREIGAFLYQQGEESFHGRRRDKAAHRMQKAVEIDPTVELGQYSYLVADEYFADSDYENSARFYAKAVSEYPDTAAADPAYLNLATSYAQTGAPTRARETLETLLSLRPEGSLATQAHWQLANLLFEEGEKQFLLGNYEETVAVIEELLSRTRNPGLRQKGRFLLGETYEAMGDFDQAYRQYQKIIDVDRGASGRIVERAREKIAALREAGLY